MAKVVRATVGTGFPLAAFALKDYGTRTEVFAEARVMFTSATAAEIIANAGELGSPLGLWDSLSPSAPGDHVNIGITVVGWNTPGVLEWWTGGFAGDFITGAHVEPDVWHEIKIHHQAFPTSTVTVTIDGDVYGPINPGAAAYSAQSDKFGIGANEGVDTVDAYVGGPIKIGTTLGGTDLFTDDFATGNLSAWDSTELDGTGSLIEVVDDPLEAPAAPPAAPFWTVEHYQHEYVPDGAHSSTLVADGSLIQVVRPENLHFVLQLGQLGPGSIDYEISIDAKDDDDNPVVSADFVGPKRTDFLLKRSDQADPIMGGMHTPVSGADGPTPIETVQLSGKDWLHYLEGRVWPYDATLSYTDWPAGFRFKVAAGEVGQIVKDILETIRDVSANYPAAPDVLGPNPSYSLGFTVDADSTGVTTNYEISNFDASTIYSLIQTLSLMGKTRGGFDFYMTWDKVFKLIAPEIGHPLSPIFSLEVDATDLGANMVSIGFTNTGPEATHVLGVGAGTSSQQGGINKHFPASSAVFRRWDKVADFGNVKNLDTLERLTSLEVAFASNPIHEIPVEVDPADIPNFWTVTRPGEYVQVIYDLGFHQISSIQRIILMDCHVDTEGQETVQLQFNQFYDASDASGIADW